MEITGHNVLFNNKGKIARQVVFSLIVLLSGLFLGMYVIGPVFRADQGSMPEKKLELNDSDINVVKAERYVSLLRSLEKRLDQEERQRHRLQKKVADLERKFNKLQLITKSIEDEGPDDGKEKEISAEVEEELDEETQLVAAGLEPQQAKSIMQFMGDIEMERLYLHDQATREGWVGTPRYREEIMTLIEREEDLRLELGDADYDLYLYGTGQPNRVVIQSVIEGSPAQDAGIQSQDIAYSYAGNRLYTIRELVTATTEGIADESVLLEVIRDGKIYEFYLPRGPLGVRVTNESHKP
ncbi:MAG: PDZ domain-containing protein [Thermodesulfobacteriota bacterium]|nr:PDZ domain-containing protein [Thermodesulfobacteriota bacterium]